MHSFVVVERIGCLLSEFQYFFFVNPLWRLLLLHFNGLCCLIIKNRFFYLFLGIKLAYKIFQNTDALSSSFHQSFKLSYGDRVKMAKTIVKRLKDLGNDETYDAFVMEVGQECISLGMGTVIFIV